MPSILSTNRPVILQIRQLTFGYAGHPLFNAWSGALPAGITIVRGGDGRGKSSMLKLFAGELSAPSGELEILQTSLQQQADKYRSQVFLSAPESHAYDQMSIREYLASLRSAYPTFDEMLLPGLIDGLSLTTHMDKQLFMLSTGSKRKVWLCGAFAAGATLNLLDDPFAGLDKRSIEFVTRQLKRVAEKQDQAWVLALYVLPEDIPFASVIDLGD